ncbi:AraC-like DNA-binding protein [Kitasatospora sp. MAP12-15]|uniref:helix-turn-helix transcriptional regulator n=1 Tax=unclassified Kitasatospora TaxID=2633591 RepID=UPI002476924A|nr:AraC family transcriptional regulator [Kitasatospora sp. MAP12-44]MDH6115519.1 AraC-like DNA-binding protein [Kitasatospora sp. MAP12-44]
MTAPPFNDEVDLGQTAERTVVDLAGLGLGPMLALGRYRYLYAHAARPPERHRTLLVLAVPVRGMFAFDVDGEVHRVRPGQAIRVPPGAAYHTGLTAEPRGELIWLIARTNAPTLPGQDDLHRALEALMVPGPLMAPGADPVRDSLERALALAGGERDWTTEALLRHTVAAAVLEATRAFTHTGSPPATWPHHRIVPVLAWIEDHIADPVTPAELADMAGLSTSHFYEAFRTATGTTPKDYLLRRKTEYARDWLQRDPAVPVTAVAHTLGFSSSQRFATIFRRYHGISPTVCRTTFRDHREP